MNLIAKIFRTQERTRNNDAKETKEEHAGQEKNIPSQRRNDDYMENHRRGATRGAVRGMTYNTKTI